MTFNVHYIWNSVATFCIEAYTMYKEFIVLRTSNCLITISLEEVLEYCIKDSNNNIIEEGVGT